MDSIPIDIFASSVGNLFSCILYHREMMLFVPLVHSFCAPLPGIDPIIFNSLSFLLLRNSSTISFSVSPFVDSVLLPFIFVCLSLSIFLLRIVYLISIFSSLHFYSLYGEREMLLFSYSFYFLSFLLRRWWGGYSNLSKFQS